MSGEIDKLFLNSVPENFQSAEADSFHGRPSQHYPAPNPAAPTVLITKQAVVQRSSSELRDIKSGNAQVTKGK